MSKMWLSSFVVSVDACTFKCFLSPYSSLSVFCLPPQCEDFPWLYQFPFQLTTHDADEVRSVVHRKKGTAHSGWMDGLTVQQEAKSNTNTSTNFFSLFV